MIIDSHAVVLLICKIQNRNFRKLIFVIRLCLEIQQNTANYTFQNLCPPKSVTYSTSEIAIVYFFSSVRLFFCLETTRAVQSTRSNFVMILFLHFPGKSGFFSFRNPRTVTSFVSPSVSVFFYCFRFVFIGSLDGRISAYSRKPARSGHRISGFLSNDIA